MNRSKSITEVNVFTNGDSNNIATWSNIPYFLCNSLVEKGIKVNRINLDQKFLFLKIFKKVTFKSLVAYHKNTSYEYFRSIFHFLNVRLRIKEAIKKYPEAEINIFLTFSFSAVGLSQKPCIQICDWPYSYHFNYFEKRKPDLFEKCSINRENRMIEGSDIVIPLFPSVADFMLSYYTNKNIFYLGNVINSDRTAGPEIIRSKSDSNTLLFIGSSKYLEGAICLIDAYKQLITEFPNLTLHIIGMTRNDFNDVPDKVQFYGYLNKTIPSESAVYYSLIERATIFINTTPTWGGFSSTIEAMSYYTPVVVNSYPDFVKTFGNKIAFGSYCDNYPVEIESKIKDILNHENYNNLCVEANKSVQSFTWDNFIDNVLKKIDLVND